MALFSLAHSVFLFPVYYLEGPESPEFTLETLTLGNLPRQDDALYVALIPIYTISIYVMYLIWYEFLEFKARRQFRMSLREIDNYSVILENLPPSLRNSEDLYELLESLFPENLESVYIPADVSKLRKLINTRVKTRNSLENFLIREQNPQEPCCPCTCPRRESNSARVDRLYKKLEELNHAVMQQVQLVENGPESSVSKKARPLVERGRKVKQSSTTEKAKDEDKGTGEEETVKKESEKEETQKDSKSAAVEEENSDPEDLLAKEKEKVRQLPLREIKAELQQLGIDVSSFYEKSQFVDALAEARMKKTDSEAPTDSKEAFNYEKTLAAEQEVVKAMSLKNIKAELENFEIDYSSFVEKSQFVDALAKARTAAKEEEQSGKRRKKRKKKKSKSSKKTDKTPTELPKCCMACVTRRRKYRKREIFQKRFFKNKCCNTFSNGLDYFVWLCSVAAVKAYRWIIRTLKACNRTNCKACFRSCRKGTTAKCQKLREVTTTCCKRCGGYMKRCGKGMADKSKKAKAKGKNTCSRCCASLRAYAVKTGEFCKSLKVKTTACCTKTKVQVRACCQRSKEACCRKRSSSKPAVVESSMAFVTFRSLQASTLFRQAISSEVLPRHLTSPGPILTDMDWNSVPAAYKTKLIKRAVSFIATGLVVIFWSIPTAFVGALSAVENLKQELPFLADALEAAPWLGGLIEQLSPLLLVILGALAPIILGALTGLEGHISRSKADASLFTKLAAFQVVQTFFVAAISGSLFNVITEVIEDPALLPPLLGGSIPGQSTFFMQFISIQTGLTLTLDLLRVSPVITASIYKCCAPQTTWRQRESAWLGMTRITEPGQMTFASKLGSAFVVFLLSVVYAPLAPLLTYFTGLYFLVAEVVQRRQALYIHDPFLESQAMFWPQLYDFVLAACLIAQITLLGVLSLKESPAAAAVLPLILATIVAFNYISRRMSGESKYLALDRAVDTDAIREEDEWFDTEYYQPELFEGYLMEPELSKPQEKDNLMSPSSDE